MSIALVIYLVASCNCLPKKIQRKVVKIMFQINRTIRRCCSYNIVEVNESQLESITDRTHLRGEIDHGRNNEDHQESPDHNARQPKDQQQEENSGEGCC